MLSGIFKTTALTVSAVAACLALTACESPGGRVSVLQSDTIRVTPGSTYAWAPDAQPGSGDPRIDNDIVQGRIKTAVDTALQGRGFTQAADPSSATLLVQFHIGLQNRSETQVSSFGAPNRVGPCGLRGCIGGFGWGMYGAPMDVDVRTINYTEGTLMLDLIDRASGKLAWRATSQRRMDQGDSDQAKANAIVADMVRSLP